MCLCVRSCQKSLEAQRDVTGCKHDAWCGATRRGTARHRTERVWAAIVGRSLHIRYSADMNAPPRLSPEPSTQGMLAPNAVSQALEWLREADGLVVAAGAGMGVDSGLPDFRGNEGMWRTYPALGRASIDFTAIASPDAFRRDPRLAWGFYGHRLALYRATTPHAGFDVLHRWAGRMAHGAFVYTSNVDGHFQKAGFPAERVAECHGRLHQLQCMEACRMRWWPADDWEPVVDADACELRSALPTCPDCGGLARPNVLMFNDYEWVPELTELQLSRLEMWLTRVLSDGSVLRCVHRLSALICARARSTRSLGSGSPVPPSRY